MRNDGRLQLCIRKAREEIGGARAVGDFASLGEQLSTLINTGTTFAKFQVLRICRIGQPK